jgi:hypothetical protein
MKLFRSAVAMRDEIGKMKNAERYRREDRAIVSNFFNGAAPLTDAEAEELGFTVNVNHLFGYSELTAAKDQVFSLFTKPARLLEVDLDAAPPGKREIWRMKAQESATRVLRKVTTFKNAYEGVSGDAALHGEGVFFFPNGTFPLPRQAPLSKLLVPDDTPADSTSLTHFCIEGELSVSELHRYWKKKPQGWNAENLGKILTGIYKDCLSDGRELDAENVEEMEYRRQENSASSSRRRPGVDVYYFYQQRPDKSGCPFDLTILLKSDPDEAKEEAPKSVLYEGESAYASVHDCIHPFFMDCIIGGAPKWHRVLGLGHLNYQINHAVELLVNRAQQATIEGSMNLWQAKDSATRESVQQILLKHNGVLPEGIDLIQNRFAPNFGGILEMIQFFRQAGSKNAKGVTPNNGDQNDQLEVQAMFEQNVAASSSNARSSNWYDYLDRMWAKVFERLTNPFIDPKEPGYSEVMDFQAEMQRANVPLYYLQPHNVQVRAVRLVGDGLRSKELAAAQFLTTNRSSYAPEVQPKITRMVTALALDNYKLAEELTPLGDDEEKTGASLDPKVENAIMRDERQPLKPHPADIDEQHVIGHFPAMEVMIRDAVQYQKAAFTPPQMEAFQCIGGHTIVHIQRIEERAKNNRNDPDREKARAMMDQLNQMAAMGEKLAHNMQQTQGGGDEMSPAEMAKLQLEAQKLELGRQKLEHASQKFSRTQGTREQSMAFEQVLKLERDRREGRRAEKEGVLRDVEVAAKVAGARSNP